MVCLHSDYRNLKPKKRSKIGWIETHYHQKELLRKSYASVVVIGDSIVAGLRPYPTVWRNFILQYKTVNLALPEKKNFPLTEICEKGRKDHVFVSFCMFPFTEISYFLSFSLKENVRKQHFPANAYFCINMKFSNAIAGRKDEIFYLVL